MTKLLVTGGAGFIGANFIQYWAKKYPDDNIVVLDALTYAGNQASLEPVASHPGYRFVHGDIRNRELVTNILVDDKVDTIVHFAAESHVDRSIHEPDAFIRTNVTGTYDLLEVTRDVWLGRDDAPATHRFHHVSTDEVYGALGPEDPAFTEETPYAPNSPYAASKAAADHIVRSYHHTYGLQVTTSNCSNNFGPYQFPEKLIPLMMVNALTGKPLPIYGDGSNIRDWLYVDDHCTGIDQVIKKGRVGETYNIGGNCERNNISIVREICSLIDQRFRNDAELAGMYKESPAASGKPTESLITYVKDRPGHDWRYAIDASKIENELNYAPQENFESGLARAVDWMLANEPWWRAVMDGSYRNWIDTHYT